jgi:hypothetical protein
MLTYFPLGQGLIGKALEKQHDLSITLPGLLERDADSG